MSDTKFIYYAQLPQCVVRYSAVFIILMLAVGLVAGVSIGSLLFAKVLTVLTRNTTVYSTVTLTEKIRIVVLVIIIHTGRILRKHGVSQYMLRLVE